MAEGPSRNTEALCEVEGNFLADSKQPPETRPSSTVPNDVHEKEEADMIGRQSPRTDSLDPRYKVHRDPLANRAWFTPGKVFKVLWAEPHGIYDGISFNRCQANGSIHQFEKVRRFVILCQDRRHSICLPVTTYGNQGDTKARVQAKDYRKVHTFTKHIFTESCTCGKASNFTIECGVKFGDPNDIWDTQSSESYNPTQSSLSRILERIDRATNTAAMLNVASGCAMATSFIWLNKRMELSPSSKAINAITSKSIPSPNITHALDIIPTEAILATFVLATAIFTGSAILWAATNTGTKGGKSLVWSITTIVLVICFFAGFTAEELPLVCLPLSFSLGSGTSCMLGLLKSDAQHCPDCDHACYPACDMEKDVIFEA